MACGGPPARGGRDDARPASLHRALPAELVPASPRCGTISSGSASRSWTRARAADSPAPRPSRAPGCAWAIFPPAAIFPTRSSSPDDTLLPPDVLRHAFEGAGLDLAKPITATCGSGVSACVLALGLAALGRRDVAVYDGSWVSGAAVPTRPSKPRRAPMAPETYSLVLWATTTTAPEYRLYALDTTPPKPGLLTPPGGGGAAIEVEVWALDAAALGVFVAAIPAPLGVGRVVLADGTEVTGFLCEPHTVEHAREITASGGWPAHLADA